MQKTPGRGAPKRPEEQQQKQMLRTSKPAETPDPSRHVQVRTSHPDDFAAGIQRPPDDS
jgi:hypothetical protein